MFKKYKPHFILLFLFIGYLYFVTRIVAIKIPCLMSISSDPASYDNCNFKVASDYFLLYAGLAWVISVIILFLDSRLTKRFAFFAVIFTAIFISSYYLYINKIEEKIINAPIYLDSLIEEK